MKIKQLLPKFDVKVRLVELMNGSAGMYDPRTDVILIDRGFKADNPYLADLTLLHEIAHSTLLPTRTARINRLVHKLGDYSYHSKAYKMEECIAELAAMVLARKLGILTMTSMQAYILGISKYYEYDMVIPWREVTAAARYYAADDADFKVAELFVKNVMRIKYKLDIRDTYDSDNSTGTIITSVL